MDGSFTVVPSCPAAGTEMAVLYPHPDVDKSTLDSNKTLHEAGLNSIILVCGYTPFIVLATIANLLLILTYLRCNKVRAVPTNALIFSLAIADFLVGSSVLTVSLVWTYRGHWIFGEIFCRVWSVLDYTATYMSTAMMVLISFDRYLLVTKNIRYRIIWTRKRAVSLTLVCWLYSILYYSILAAPIVDSVTVDFQEECELELVYLVPFTIGNLVFEFGIPFSLIIYLNASVYYKIYQLSRDIVMLKPGSDAKHVTRFRLKALKAREARHAPTDSTISSDITRSDRLSSFDTDIVPCVSTISGDTTRPDCHVSSDGSTNQQHRGMMITKQYPDAVSDQPKETSDTKGQPCLRRHQNRKYLLHKKAGITLSILVGTYLACWLPFVIISILQAMCGEDECFSETVWEAVNGLLWCNSALNPFLYGFNNPLIRREVMSLLRNSRFGKF